MRAERNYEGKRWVAYDRQYRRQALAKQNLNWSVTDARLYNEAFTGRAHLITRCSFCLQDDHTSSQCPRNPNRPIFGWFQDPAMWYGPPYTNPFQAPARGRASPLVVEICRKFNNGRCRFNRCRYHHTCSDCGGNHPRVTAREAPNDRDRGAVLHLRLRDGVQPLSLQARHSGNK